MSVYSWTSNEEYASIVSDLITDSAELARICERFAVAEFITIDTEFMREKTYYSQLCLVQIADDEGAVAIDPLADGLDLAPLYTLLNDAPCVKVFHACRQDIEIFFHATGKIPTPIFDSQVAAMVCGYGDSVSYEALVRSITEAQIDKSARFTDWSRRPLSSKQLSYALSDVTHLRKIYRTLKARLEREGRESWVEEEMTLLTAPGTYEMIPEEAWKRVKLKSRKPRLVAMVRAIATWREKEAQRRNMPRNRIFRDDSLMDLAGHPPKNIEGFARIRGFGEGFARSRFAKDLMRVVQETQALPEDALPKVEREKNRGEKAGPIADLLKLLLKINSRRHHVAPKLIANALDLEMLSADPDMDHPLQHGWRFEVFGRDAQALMRGELAFAAKDKAIQLVDLT